jgi:Arc/MetJ family transcription regulator
MKMTLEVDGKKLEKLMKLTGIKTKRAAVDFALTRAETAARREKVLGLRLSPEDLADCVDPGYDVLKLREVGRAR